MKLTLAFLFLSLFTASAAPIISEIVADNETGLQDEDEAFVDWIELFNPDDAPFNLEGHFLTDDLSGRPERWELPAVTLEPNAFLVLYASGKDRRDPAANLHTNFKLTSGGETVALVAPDGAETLASITFPPLEIDHSYVFNEGTYSISNKPTPGEVNASNIVVFSVKGQAFTDNIVVELSSPGGQSIRYTTDGKRPSLFNGKDYSGPITLTETTLLSATTGGGPLLSEAFIEISPELANRSSDLPFVIADTSGNLSQTSMREMIFAVIEPGNDGRAQLVSEFQISTRGGIRTRGETSNGFPKKPLRVEFWDADGEDRPLSPLGMPGEADWVLNARYDFDRTLVHNTWIYELSNQLGEWAPQTRFVELYLNDNDDPISVDDYNGVYTFLENIQRGKGRVDVETMEISDTEAPAITGGYVFRKDKTDPNTWNFSGGGENLQMIYPREEERSQRGHQGEWLSDYLDDMRTAINEHGSDPELGYAAFIDEDSWLNHHQLNFLTNNVDGLRLSAYFHKPQGGKLRAGPAWDFDRSAGGPTDGRIANPLQWGDGSGGTAYFVRGNNGTPIWWEDLFANPDFLMNWVDRWYGLRQSEMVTPTWDPEATPLPAFSDENVARIIDHMADELNESQARNFDKWSSARPRNAGQLRYSDQDGYAGEIEHIKGWLAARAEWIEDELIFVPTFAPADSVQEGPISIKVTDGGNLFTPATVYYTTDGTDPRQAGGEPGATAIKRSGDIAISTSARVQARRLDADYTADRWGPALQWSAPADRYYFVDTVPASESNLIVSEIMYHPSAPSEEEIAALHDDADDFEFIELRNISSDRVDLSESRLRGDADFNFPDGTILESGEHAVIVANAAAFTMRYGSSARIVGDYSNRLGNGNGTIRLRDFNGAIAREFAYDDKDPWPTEADGQGRSLVLNQPTSNPDANEATSWSASAEANGTPGSDGSTGGGGDSAYDLWLAEKFDEAQRNDARISGLNADVDQDGLVTLAEFYFAGDPVQADADKTPRVTLSEAGDTLSLHYQMRRNSGVIMKVEFSEDLVVWEEVDASKLTTLTTREGGESGNAITSISLDSKPANHVRFVLSLAN